MSENDNERPRPSDRYWATVDPIDLGPQISSRFRDYQRELKERGILRLWNKMESAYYGYDQATNSVSSSVTESGEQGEFLTLYVNELSALLRHQLILTTSDELEFEVTAENDSAAADAQASLGEQAIAYYGADPIHACEKHLVQQCEWMLVFGEAAMVQLWDSHLGPEDTEHVAEVPVFDANGQPVMEAPPPPMQMTPSMPGMTMSMDAPMPPSGMQEPPAPQQKTRPEIRRGGDFVHKIYAPMDVARDLGARTRQEAKWRIVRERWDRWELIGYYPEHRQYILERPIYDRDETTRHEGRGPSSMRASTDQIHVLRLIHQKCAALPDGLEALVCGDRLLGPAMPLPYKQFPVFEMVPQELRNTPLAYSSNWHLLGPQAALNAAASNGLTSSDAGSVPKWAVPRDANVGVDKLAPNMRVVNYDAKPQLPNGGMPQLLQMPQFTDAHAKQMELWRQALERQSGINSVVRGESEGKSGADNALLDAKAQQYMHSNARAYADVGRAWAYGLVTGLQIFADRERLLQVVGEDENPSVEYFSGEDLAAIRQVEVRLGDPAMRTFGMRKQIADELLEKFPQQITPEMYLAFMANGRLKPFSKKQRNQQRLIASENAALSKGEPVVVMISDCHLDHIGEHLALLSSPSLRRDPKLTQMVLAHVMEHETQWQMMMARPALLAATGQPPPPMMGGPPPGEEGSEGPPDASAPPKKEPVGEPAPGGTDQPSMPTNPATGEQAPAPPQAA